MSGDKNNGIQAPWSRKGSVRYSRPWGGPAGEKGSRNKWRMEMEAAVTPNPAHSRLGPKLDENDAPWLNLTTRGYIVTFLEEGNSLP